MTKETASEIETDSSSRVEQIFSALISGLREGKYVPGQRIRDRDIAEAFGVSRTPARDAIGRLHSRGLLEVAHGGLAVRTLSPLEVVELYTVRQILEGSAARFAAQHASDADIFAIESRVMAFGEEPDPKGRAKINRHLHRAIRDAAHNSFLVRTLDELDVALSLLPGTTYEIADRSKAAYLEHVEILKAIKARDPDAAEAAARHHIAQAQQARLSPRLSRPD
ncbi:GntR family transcriptional regulator [Terrihabitans soli]|uniref:GntR family transcriptional regulator n=1 Tax=Terrihabitans soli TaxID=708113 RepID=A0A6S6QMD9_9HYPH|nr:GntR family transcriptional regulator [Terrihabitans soli]BCJ90536.1 GntR family transcriptional regulator [Terrihabitans soli]